MKVKVTLNVHHQRPIDVGQQDVSATQKSRWRLCLGSALVRKCAWKNGKGHFEEWERVLPSTGSTREKFGPSEFVLL